MVKVITCLLSEDRIVCPKCGSSISTEHYEQHLKTYRCQTYGDLNKITWDKWFENKNKKYKNDKM